ncbi:hypothetical protein [Bacteroides uniformis]|uniref:hypothetical protein n=1 Tax=Bacteroides uniformis TaxID=820 RepID=UPI0034C2A02F
MKKCFFSLLVVIGVAFIAPQTVKATTLAETSGYEIEVIYNKQDKTTTVVLYKDGVEIERVTN